MNAGGRKALTPADVRPGEVTVAGPEIDPRAVVNDLHTGTVVAVRGGAVCANPMCGKPIVAGQAIRSDLVDRLAFHAGCIAWLDDREDCPFGQAPQTPAWLRAVAAGQPMVRRSNIAPRKSA